MAERVASLWTRGPGRRGQALREMSYRYEQLIQGLSILRQLDSLDDVSLSLQEICAGALRTIAQALWAENCSLMLLDDTERNLELWAAAGCLEDEATWLPLGASLRHAFRIGEGIAGRVALTGRAVCLEDVNDCPDFLPVTADQIEIRSLLCFPLKSAGSVLGVVNLSHPEPGFFDRDAECLMELVAERLARLLATHKLHTAHRETEEYYRVVCENAGDGILVLERDGRISVANSVAANLLGVSPQSLLDGTVSWSEGVLEEDLPAWRTGRARAFESLKLLTLEYRFRDRAGMVRYLEERSTALGDSTGQVLRRIVVVRDITERKRTEQQCQNLEAQLRHAQKMEALGELAGGVTHDFNNLLTGILGNASLARTTDDPHEMAELLADIEKAAQRASVLTRRLLSMSSRSQPQRRPIKVGALLQEVAQVARNTFDRRIEIVLERQEALRPALAEGGQIHQVLLNLCVNARDALLEKAQSDPEAQLRITLAAQNVNVAEEDCESCLEAAPGRYVQLSVTDTGPGISSEIQARMFEPFFTTKGERGGTGLGLAIVYGIAKQHGGWIDVQSKVGEGTSFRVFLPASPDSYVPRPTLTPPLDLRGGTETVLLVDDEEMVRAAAQRVLQHLGYTVLLACDGKECVEVFERESSRIAVIVLDLSMPRLSGEDALARIRALDPGAKVIVSSGHTCEPASLTGPLLPSGYLRKPYSQREVAATLRRVLDGEVLGPAE